jgi:hypothetical protein
VRLPAQLHFKYGIHSVTKPLPGLFLEREAIFEQIHHVSVFSRLVPRSFEGWGSKGMGHRLRLEKEDGDKGTRLDLILTYSKYSSRAASVCFCFLAATLSSLSAIDASMTTWLHGKFNASTR